MDKHSWNAQVWQVLRARLVGPTGGVQRIREQQQSIRERILRQQHTGLPSTIALPAEKYAPRYNFSHGRDRMAQSFAIAGGISGPGRPKVSHLPEGQINSQDGKSGASESLGKRDQQRHSGIAAGAVRQDETVS
jgi:hypothetical protein